MEAFEEEVISPVDTGGLEVRFGDADLMVKLTEMIALRQGFGDILAEGSAKAAAKLGKGEEFLLTSKGLEAPAHMPQVKASMGLIYAVNPFGADHESSEHDPAYRHYPERMAMIGLTDPQPNRVLNREKVRFTLVTQHMYSILDSANLCAFVFGPGWQLFGPDQMTEAIRAVTGWDIDLAELMEIGERRVNMMRAFNAREGIGRELDTLPKKFFDKALEGGRSDGYKVDYAEWAAAMDMYYEEAGWDLDTGNPTREKLTSLDMAWLADALGV
jgi:aldehyde:ferredoxin oxidoreductase